MAREFPNSLDFSSDGDRVHPWIISAELLMAVLAAGQSQTQRRMDSDDLSVSELRM
jgi:hypothetical protein